MVEKQVTKPGPQRVDTNAIFRQNLEIGPAEICCLRCITLQKGKGALFEAAILENMPTKGKITSSLRAKPMNASSLGEPEGSRSGFVIIPRVRLPLGSTSLTFLRIP